MGTIIDLVPKSDPLRHEWGRLHGLSSTALLVRILSALALFGFGASQLMPRPAFAALPRPHDGHDGQGPEPPSPE
jgi:hypothetical protein